MRLPNRALVWKLTRIQLIVWLLLLLIFSASVQDSSWLSILMGGLVAIPGKLLFGWWFFRASASEQPKQMLQKAYLAEMFNLVTTLMAFVLVFGLVDGLNYPLLFATFICVQSVYWVAPFWVR